MRKLIRIGILCSTLVQSSAQVIPDNLRVDWSHAGLDGVLPDPQNVLNVVDYGAVPDDNIDDHLAITTAMNALNGNAGVIYFPSGVFNVNTTLNLNDSVILRGSGSDSTSLEFNFGNNGGDGIRIWKGQSSSFVNIVSGFTKGSSELLVADASSFSIGEFAELKETNGAWNSVPAAWAEDCVGQIVKISNISGDTLFLNDGLRIDYSASLNPQIRPFSPITNCGIECLRIVRADSIAPVVSYNFSFLGAANCWITGVESDHSIGAHISADLSTHLKISGCYFHHSYEYDGASTHGYGIMLIQHTGDCLIENNFFRHLRHAMMVKQGANGNVFTYNYSIEPTRTEFPTNGSGDISIHGHYPFANLFEGNIVQTLYIDQTWGPGGPYNTFFRNREDLYGIIISNGNITTNENNFVGNEITSTQIFTGLYIIDGSNHFLYGNNRQGNIDPAGTDSLPDESYYYSGLPDYWTGPISFPPIGIPNLISTNSIPARERYLNSGTITQCEAVLPTSIQNAARPQQAFSVVPNPFNTYVNIIAPSSENAEEISVVLSDINGRHIAKNEILVSPGKFKYTIAWSERLISGCYLLSLETKKTREIIQLMKH